MSRIAKAMQNANARNAWTMASGSPSFEGSSMRLFAAGARPLEGQDEQVALEELGAVQATEPPEQNHEET